MERAGQYINTKERIRALYPIKVNTWLRENPFKKPRVNAELFGLGSVVAHIIGDDASFMTVPMMRFSEGESPESIKDLLNDKRLALLDRIEAERQELSLIGRHNRTRVIDKISGRLGHIYEAIERESWADLISVHAAYMLWLPTREHVIYQAATNDKLRKAKQHYEDLNTFVFQEYQRAISKSGDFEEVGK
jgi:hypothetical protein